MTPIVPNKFSVNLRYETRGLNISGDVTVFASQGKGHDSGWSRVRAGLEALGFRLTSDSVGALPPMDDVPTRDDPLPDYWRCRTCGCLWRDNHDDTVSLGPAKQTSCVVCEMTSVTVTCEPLFRG